MKGPLADFNESVANFKEAVAKLYAGLVPASEFFAAHGDPREWTEFDGKTPITWRSDFDREKTIASYDEWIAGGWNEVPGVVRPGIRLHDSLPLVS